MGFMVQWKGNWRHCGFVPALMCVLFCLECFLRWCVCVAVTCPHTHI